MWLAPCVTKWQLLIGFMSSNLQHGVWLRLVILQVLEPDIKHQPSTGLKRSLCFFITNLFIETAIKYHCWRYFADELTSIPMTHRLALEEGNEFIILPSALPPQWPYGTKLSKMYSGFPSSTPLISKIWFLMSRLGQ